MVGVINYSETMTVSVEMSKQAWFLRLSNWIHKGFNSGSQIRTWESRHWSLSKNQLHLILTVDAVSERSSALATSLPSINKISGHRHTFLLTNWHHRFRALGIFPYSSFSYADKTLLYTIIPFFEWRWFDCPKEEVATIRDVLKENRTSFSQITDAILLSSQLFHLWEYTNVVKILDSPTKAPSGTGPFGWDVIALRNTWTMSQEKDNPATFEVSATVIISIWRDNNLNRSCSLFCQ